LSWGGDDDLLQGIEDVRGGGEAYREEDEEGGGGWEEEVVMVERVANNWSMSEEEVNLGSRNREVQSIAGAC
jgi:hypothetical protein